MREPQKDDAQPHKRQSARVARDACRPVPARGKEQEHACGGRSINLGHAQAAEEDEDWEDGFVYVVGRATLAEAAREAVEGEGGDEIGQQPVSVRRAANWHVVRRVTVRAVQASV